MNSERQTRQEKIDLQLGRAGWAVGSRRLIEEFIVAPASSLHESEADYRAVNQFADYVLLDRFDRPLAIIEAKRSSRNPLEGERQAADYADTLRAKHGTDPFVFLANGNEIWFWHRNLYPPRKVSGFFTEEDLLRLAHLDKFGQPLTGAMPLEGIIDRAYQIEAVKTIAERIESAKRSFLMVLATGTGKTRVAVALVELLQRQERIQRVLFLADRRELVKQALGAFKEHLPGAPRCWIEGGTIDKDAQIHFATYPGMMSLYQRLSPGYYDLIIADESHRSIYEKESYGGIFDHFDSLLLGLTATPTDFLDHNTFKLFDCPDGNPTFYYGYDEAVRDKHLVPYRPVHVARTGFQIEGLKPGELPDEVSKQVREQGVNPDQFSFEGSELERKVTNTGTNDAIVREFMDNAIKDAVGTLPAKTIIFAVSHNHALEIFKSFNRLYPDLQRKGLAKVIDSAMERAEKTLDDFKNKNFPRVAISVDMLDTGIDVPSIRNLVFAKPVFSKVKFWQMIGRGTRTWTDPVNGQKKADFLVIDHWDNFDYFQVNKDGRAGAVSEPLPSRLFRLRLEKLQILVGRSDSPSATYTVRQLRDLMGSLPLDNINITPHADEIRRLAANDEPWLDLTDESVAHLSQIIAPLLRFSVAGSYAELQFENQTEQLALAQLKADVEEIAKLRERITEHLSLLPASIPEIQPHLEALVAAQTDAFWGNLTCARIMQLQETFAPLMRFRNRRPPGIFVHLTLPDQIKRRHWIIYGPTGEGAFAESYRAQVEALVKDLAGDNPALQRLQRGEELSPEDIEAVAAALNGPDLFVTEERLREAYHQPKANLADFLRHILNIVMLPSREESISRAFDEWVRQHPRLTATQLMFVRTLRKAVMQKAEISSLAALRKPPFNTIGDPEQLFKLSELSELFDLITDIAA
ncbi:DEAD/DEAH box helicase family protein [Geobacter sp. AOG2]|uniref:type I restriction endonuclease subunit R n=1 Tax=Geobacter sp. AOG2 TaxID=1566347 RepID=UPI001CC74607|nr:type I restriction endonuclease subunit R [Geobacter sp. AOG2]GFE60793.1 type I restriction-modification system restriction subunit [Geobacter sp. AOG2]